MSLAVTLLEGLGVLWSRVTSAAVKP